MEATNEEKLLLWLINLMYEGMKIPVADIAHVARYNSKTIYDILARQQVNRLQIKKMTPKILTWRDWTMSTVLTLTSKYK